MVPLALAAALRDQRVRKMSKQPAAGTAAVQGSATPASRETLLAEIGAANKAIEKSKRKRIRLVAEHDELVANWEREREQLEQERKRRLEEIRKAWAKYEEEKEAFENLLREAQERAKRRKEQQGQPWDEAQKKAGEEGARNEAGTEWRQGQYGAYFPNARKYHKPWRSPETWANEDIKKSSLLTKIGELDEMIHDLEKMEPQSSSDKTAEAKEIRRDTCDLLALLVADDFGQEMGITSADRRYLDPRYVDDKDGKIVKTKGLLGTLQSCPLFAENSKQTLNAKAAAKALSKGNSQAQEVFRAFMAQVWEPKCATTAARKWAGETFGAIARVEGTVETV